MFPALFAYQKKLPVMLTTLVVINIASFLLVAQLVSPAFALQDTANAAAAPTVSRNWSGYVATAGPFTSVTGSWVVPQVTKSSKNSADATWVGIGGLNSNDLIQSGTQNIIGPGGHVTPLAFFEQLPQVAQTIPVAVNAGDTITVSLTTFATNQWHLTFQNTTTGQVFRATEIYPSTLSSAEWIEEAPSRNNKILTLDQFGSVQFSGATTIARGSRISLAQSGAHSIILASKKGQTLASPSLPGSDGASFTVTRA